jgi:hypothetical protein
MRTSHQIEELTESIGLLRDSVGHLK